VPPGEALEVVRLAGPFAVRAREQRATVGDHLKVQLMRPLLDIQPMTGKLPRLVQTKPEREHVLRVHPTAPHAAIAPACKAPRPRSTVSRFHLERRGAHKLHPLIHDRHLLPRHARLPSWS